mmetsp:Transcript_20218/g.56899  ORF Transcript_20218/g.56899 Transcript_20218/m.56899 type:complete len:365 (+) Transcript_20218:157-1251(+)|eukprot:CAMPEP_0119137656 /NCGR_PEP_ID=MMETSP1310-20130426/24077_1 /TAXON_ID=464262 /ORGANISM="Genus nov. species nov., Strain RCC2339" /LENGTH=364 /DNA_ID=CAMNT_0007128767 /DNA_START=154 /DNA_END=1248 /DNA_ORIENTATION=-
MANYLDDVETDKISGPLTVDIHTHILPSPGVLPDLKKKYGYGGFVSLENAAEGCGCNMVIDGNFFRAVEPNVYDPKARVSDCDRDGVHVQVLSTVPVMFSYWAKPQDCLDLCRMINDDIANTVKSNPKRFVGLATLPMQAPDLAVQELRRCMTELGLRGFEMGTHINDWNLDAEELFPVFEEAEKLGAAIFIHPWDMMSKSKMEKYWLPWLVGMPAETSLAICSLIFGGVFERLPKLRVAFAHGGGAFPGTIGRIEHGHRVRPDLCAINNEKNPKQYLGRFWVDSILHDETMLKYIIDLLGEDKLVMGSDYPFPLGEYVPPKIYPGRLIREVYRGDENTKMRSKLLGQNALDWLGLKAEDFLDS